MAHVLMNTMKAYGRRNGRLSPLLSKRNTLFRTASANTGINLCSCRNYSILNPVSISTSNAKITVIWEKQGSSSSYHSPWLRHNCHCEQCRDGSSGQRLCRSSPLLTEYVIKKAYLSSDERNLEINIEEESNHVCVVPLEFLYNNSYDPVLTDLQFSNKCPPPLMAPIPTMQYRDILDKDVGFHSWLSLIAEKGLVLLKNVPTELGTVKKVGELIAPIQETVYGKVFDVQATEDAINVAYTSTRLDLHMDLVCYESPPGLQLLHCVEYDSCVTGGESMFLDVFQVAREFQTTHPEDFHVLSSVPATFQKIHFNRTRPVHMTYGRPHIVTNGRGEVIAINWSPPFEGPLKVHPELVDPYYQAYGRFQQAVNGSKNTILFQLEPGDLVTFNNHRILHGREEFRLNGGMRHLQGVYINIDEFKSEYHCASLRVGKPYEKFHMGNVDMH